MEPANDKIEEMLPIMGVGQVLEWLEDQAREGVRGQINDKPRWSE